MKISEIKSGVRTCAFPVTTRTEQLGWLNCLGIRSLFLLYSYLKSSQKLENRIHSLWLTSKRLPTSHVTTDHSACFGSSDKPSCWKPRIAFSRIPNEYCRIFLSPEKSVIRGNPWWLDSITAVSFFISGVLHIIPNGYRVRTTLIRQE